jgi:hypothetical protein
MISDSSPSPKHCILCGCSDGRPCLGVSGTPIYKADRIARLVSDPGLLAPGRTCHWAVETNLGPVCSAHSLAEAERLAGIIDPDEPIWGGT